MSSLKSVNIDEAWLFERGLLHDARITKVEHVGTDLLIGISDQWANFRGLNDYRGPDSGTLVVGDLRGGPRIDPGVLLEMISEANITQVDGGVSLVIACFGRHLVAAMGQSVVWRSDLNSN